MGDVRRMDDYVYLVFDRRPANHVGDQCVAVCEDMATADQWIWRYAADTRDYYSIPKFLHPKGSVPVQEPQALPKTVGVTLTEYNRRWHEIMTAFAEGRLAPDQASAAVRELTQQMVWR